MMSLVPSLAYGDTRRSSSMRGGGRVDGYWVPERDIRPLERKRLTYKRKNHEQVNAITTYSHAAPLLDVGRG